jgi:hypothetical protein
LALGIGLTAVPRVVIALDSRPAASRKASPRSVG